MTLPEDIVLMKKRPGRYAISLGHLLRESKGVYFMVEVDEEGTVYQLTPKGERDGVLNDDGWGPNVRAHMVDEHNRIFVRLAPVDHGD